MTYLIVEDLNKIFITDGAYFKKELDGEVYTCRRLAKINRIGIEMDVADALLVMVNPGSCQPADERYKFPSYTTGLMKIPLTS